MGFSSAGDKMAGDLVQGKKEKTTKTKTTNNFALLHRYLPAYATGIMTA